MTTPPRILFVGTDPVRSGAPAMLLHLIRWLRRNTDWSLALAVPAGGALLGAFRAEVPTTICELPRPGGSFASRLAGRARAGLGIDAALCRRRRAAARSTLPGAAFDAVYCNSAAAAGLLDAFGPFDCPVIVHVHELPYVMGHLWWLPDPAGVLRRHATRYVACAEVVAEMLVDRYGVDAGRVSTVHGFVDSDELRVALSPAARAALLADAGFPADVALIGMVGTVEWRKGADLLVPLAQAVGRRRVVGGRRIGLVWVGGGMPDEVERVRFDIAAAGLDAEVRLVGPTDRVADWCRCFEAFALLSREDPFPLAALEAAAAGVPVVCFRGGGGMPEFVGDDAGRVLPYLDVGAFADALVDVVTDASLRQRLGATAAGRVRTDHDVSVAAPRIRDIVMAELRCQRGSSSVSPRR